MTATSEAALLRALVEGVEAEVGEGFFLSLVRHLARALDVEYAFVSELTRGGSHFKSRAFWRGDAPGEPFEVPVAGTPCEAVLRGEVALHPERLQELFPEDSALVDWRAVSYGGVPLVDSQGRCSGHLAFLDVEPIGDASRALSVMRLFARRAVAEIERLRTEQTLREGEERLRRILQSATDAILCCDAEGRIGFLNQAAERILRWPAAQALGSSLLALVPEGTRATLEAAMRRLETDPGALLYHDEGEGLQARRADGTLFPFEASLSLADVAGRSLFTLILRDVAERRAAARELTRLRRQNEYLREEIEHPVGEIVGASPGLRGVLERVELVSGTEATVLVTGETGTGKELVARAIHARSARSGRPLVKVNCAGIPAGLVESELFGHERGAFTGATQRRIGRFELADHSTLLLDEVGELPLEAQAKLLRVLQEREFERVGGTTTLRTHVRVIAATNRDLPAAIAEGRFREDLYYRLNVFPLHVPPLRERPEDLPLLARHFVARHAPRMGRRAPGFAAAALERLARYPWPGNVRELENVIERALVFTRAGETELGAEVFEPLLPELREPAATRPIARPAPTSGEAPDASLEGVERDHILATLEATGWRIEGRTGAASRLGLAASSLRSRMRKLGIRRRGR